MKHLTLTVSVLAVTATSAFASTCRNEGGGSFVCDQADSAPIVLQDQERAQVNSGASVVSDDDDVPPVTLNGDGASVYVTPNGVIENKDDRGQAVLGRGDNNAIDNDGRIISGDRGIVMEGGSNLRVNNDGVIQSRRQAIRAGTDSPGAYVVNRGLIQSDEGRALQLRSYGATVLNYGTLLGAEEVVEARGNFRLENYGTIRISDPTIEDEDGVQFAGGSVHNEGLIEGTDDGIDLDEGTIFNGARGVIRSLAPDENDNSGIDVDEVYKDGVNPKRAPGTVRITNEGLIEGPSAIGTDPASTSSLEITNSGRLVGRGGTSVRMAEGQGASSIVLRDTSTVVGDILFGNGNDRLSVVNLTSGTLVDGVINGRGGVDIADFTGYNLLDFSGFAAQGNAVSFNFVSAGQSYAATFLNFESWVIGTVTYDVAGLRAAIGNPAPVPLPAGLPLLLLGLGGLSVLRRRR